MDAPQDGRISNFTGCLFVGNLAGERGGAVYHQTGDALYQATIFDYNMANDTGGGAWASIMSELT